MKSLLSLSTKRTLCTFRQETIILTKIYAVQFQRISIIYLEETFHKIQNFAIIVNVPDTFYQNVADAISTSTIILILRIKITVIITFTPDFQITINLDLTIRAKIHHNIKIVITRIIRNIRLIIKIGNKILPILIMKDRLLSNVTQTTQSII